MESKHFISKDARDHLPDMLYWIHEKIVIHGSYMTCPMHTVWKWLVPYWACNFITKSQCSFHYIILLYKIYYSIKRIWMASSDFAEVFLLRNKTNIILAFCLDILWVPCFQGLLSTDISFPLYMKLVLPGTILSQHIKTIYWVSASLRLSSPTCYLKLLFLIHHKPRV